MTPRSLMLIVTIKSMHTVESNSARAILSEVYIIVMLIRDMAKVKLYSIDGPPTHSPTPCDYRRLRTTFLGLKTTAQYMDCL